MKNHHLIIGISVLIVIFFVAAMFYENSKKNKMIAGNNARFVGGTACQSTVNGKTCYGYTRVDNAGYTYCDCSALTPNGISVTA